MKVETRGGSVAENIKLIIARKGLKQKAVAKAAGFGEKEFSAMLTNRKIIKANEIMDIANALDVEPNDLYGLTKSELG